MKTIEIKISHTKYNDLLKYISEYDIPLDDEIQDKIRLFIFNKLVESALNNDNMDASDFYFYMEEITVKKFKLKKQ